MVVHDGRGLRHHLRAGEPPYYTETWQLAYSYATWDEQLLDRGWKVLVSGELVNATDDAGKALSEPVLMDGAGMKLTTGDDPVSLPYRLKREVSFASIPV